MTENEFKALGKGLSSLIPNKLDFNITNTRSSLTVNIATDKIIANNNQPRKSFNNEEILELSSSIKLYGIFDGSDTFESV